MNNLYRKVAVASVGIALGFVLGANKEAKAATFTFAPAITFEVIDLDRGDSRFDGRGDLVYPRNFADPIVKGTLGEAAEFTEFNLGNFSLDPNTTINRAVFQAQIFSFLITGLGLEGPINPGSLGIFGYVGNGAADASDLEAGVFLSSVDISSLSVRDLLSFDVTPFVKQRVSNGDSFAGFGIRALNLGAITLRGSEFPGIQPTLIVETTEVAEAVPEPTTILGSMIALGLGGLLKRKSLS